MRNFRNFEIWQNGMNLAKEIYNNTSMLPNTENFGLKSQMQRAAVSIPSNIAEGCSRESDVEFKRFLEIALGSAFELETQLTLSKELYFDNSKDIEVILNNLNIIQKQINSFIQKLKSDSKKPSSNSQQPMANHQLPKARSQRND